MLTKNLTSDYAVFKVLTGAYLQQSLLLNLEGQEAVLWWQ
jgi:hypothetical protein